jgi:hypothetical protein
VRQGGFLPPQRAPDAVRTSNSRVLSSGHTKDARSEHAVYPSRHHSLPKLLPVPFLARCVSRNFPDRPSRDGYRVPRPPTSTSTTTGLRPLRQLGGLMLGDCHVSRRLAYFCSYCDVLPARLTAVAPTSRMQPVLCDVALLRTLSLPSSCLSKKPR